MQEQAAAIENGHSATEDTTVVAEPSCTVAEWESVYTGSVDTLPCIAGVVYLTLSIFFLVLFYRLVRATEKIAAKLERGITVKNENFKDTVK